jgi:hypothetical protein
MATELAVVSNANLAVDYRTCFEPTNFEQALKFAEYLSKSDLVPNDYKGKPANVFVAMQHGKELGLSPLQAVQSIANINGRPGVFGDTQLALVQVHPDYEWHKEWIDGVGDKMVAHFQVKRRGQDVHESTFSVDDAKTAGLWDPRPTITKRDGGTMQNPSPWHCYPKVMLKFRARGFGLRDKFADAMKGLKSAEELADYPGETIEGQVSEPTVSQSAATQAKSTPMAITLIKQDDAREFGKAWKASGFTVAEAKASLKQICNVEASLDIPADKYQEAMRWATKNPNWPDAVPPAGPDEKIVRELFSILGYDLAKQAAAIDESKGDWAGLAMKLNKELPVE